MHLLRRKSRTGVAMPLSSFSIRMPASWRRTVKPSWLMSKKKKSQMYTFFPPGSPYAGSGLDERGQSRVGGDAQVGLATVGASDSAEQRRDQVREERCQGIASLDTVADVLSKVINGLKNKSHLLVAVRSMTTYPGTAGSNAGVEAKACVKLLQERHNVVCVDRNDDNFANDTDGPRGRVLHSDAWVGD